jgi:hypothetical protein
LGCGDNAEHLISEFGWSSFFKIIFNMVIPGSGTLGLLCKYGCDCYIILVGLVQMFGGIFFFLSLRLFFTGECPSETYEKAFMDILETTQKNSEDYTYFTTVFNYFYTMGLCFYFSGIILILILDYAPERKMPISIEELAYMALSLLTGGLGFLLFLPAFVVYFHLDRWGNQCFAFLVLIFFPIGGFICFGGFLYDLFFWGIASKACRIAFPICYFTCFSCFQVISKLIYRL